MLSIGGQGENRQQILPHVHTLQYRVGGLQKKWTTHALHRSNNERKMTTIPVQ